MATNGNVPFQANATELIACDVINGLNYQRVKQVWGVDGSQVDTSTTNPMPIQPQIWDPVGVAFAVSRAATADGMAGTAVPAKAPALYNGSTLDRWQGKNGVGEVTTGGRSTTAVAAGTATNTVIKGTAGRLARILVTATGTAGVNLFDNATTNSGTIIGAIPANAAVGTIYDLNMPAANGITVGGAVNTPGITISYT